MPITGGTSSVILFATINTKKVAIKVPLRSESVNPRYNQVSNSEALLGQRAPVGTFVGQLSYEGSIEMELFDVTDAGTTPLYRHALAGILLYSVLGNYDDVNKKINLGSTAPKFDAIKIVHGGSSTIYYTDVYVTNLRMSFTTDGIATATLDVKATNRVTTWTEPTLDWDYSNFNYTAPYNPKHYGFKVGTNTLSSKVARFEITIPQEVTDYYAFGNLNAQGVSPTRLNMAEIAIEYYPDSITAIDLDSTLETAFSNGAPLSTSISLTLDSPLKSGQVLELKINNPYVTEFTHDINGIEYITSNLTLQGSPVNIEVTGVDLNRTA